MDTTLLVITAGLFAIVAGDLEELRGGTKTLPDLDVCAYDTTKKIIGGAEAKSGEYPWLAALEYKRISTGANEGIKCGGNVINTRYVLTAAHCIYPRDHELIKVWLGVWKISTVDTTDKDKVTKFDIERKIVHEDYKSVLSGNDIALVKLADDITYTTYIRPLCLPIQDLPLPPLRTKLTVTGWGLTEHNQTSDIKLKVDVPVVDNNVCTLELGVGMIESQMCAGTEKLKDSCVGDSGGPLMQTTTDTTTGKIYWFPHGLVSYGAENCGEEFIPAVYTRVSKFITWIENNTI